VILDYGHNPAAVKAIADMVGRLDVSGRRIGVVSAPGDRRDEDIREIARTAGDVFDHLILRRDDDRRGEARRSAAAAWRRHFAKRALGATGSVIVDEQQAIDAALRMAPRRRPPRDLRRQHHALVEARSSTSRATNARRPMDARASRGSPSSNRSRAKLDRQHGDRRRARVRLARETDD
jgi:hypothetical protein